jgi:PAS domain S-box-containing protein
MRRRSDPPETWEEQRDRIIGLGEHSARKSYYPELKAHVQQLEGARKSLTELNSFLQAVMDSATEIAIIATTPDGTITLFNRGAERLLGYQAVDMVGKATPLLFHRADELDRHAAELLAAYGVSVSGFQIFTENACRQHSEKLEWTYIHHDGRLIPVELVVTAIREDERITGYLGMATDISERKEVEEQLRASEQRLRALFEGAPIGVFRTTLDGRFLQVNNAQATMFGFASPQEMMAVINPAGSAANLWVSPEERAAFVERVVSAGGRYIQEEVHLRRRDGAPLEALFSAMLSSDPQTGDPCLLGFITDLTDRKLLEEQLRQSQKMESVGRLAGGVAHDFNNMLTVILSGVQLAGMKLAPGDPVHKYLDMIARAGERSTTITRQLLAFSRQEVISPKTINLNEQIGESSKLLARLITEDITFSFRRAEQLWSIRIDPSQVDQVLMNLAVNARDAMPDGGSLIIATDNVRLDAEYCRSHLDARPGKYVQLSVSDTGCGMDRATLQHIFEPFFTTKKVGEGTGLGLATVYGIVTQNEGFINVYSEPGMGTTFRIYLPRHDAETGTELDDATQRPTGSGTILLVEDEEMLLRSISEILEQMGYTVIPSSSPQEAITICRQQDRQIDLILTDVVMPEMNGREMVDQIRAFLPDSKVIFMSGYSADIVAQRGIIDEGTHYLQKPLNSNRLGAKLCEVLST